MPVQLVSPNAPVDRYLTRSGDELVPAHVGHTFLLGGAHDYAEVTMNDSRAHLVRMSLTELERRLPQ